MFTQLFKKILSVFAATGVASVSYAAGVPNETTKFLEHVAQAPVDLKKLDVEIKQLGEIDLSSGRIIAVDPLTLFGNQPFETKVKPGHYPVFIYIKELEPDHKRVAFAELRFSNQQVISWKLATIAGQDINKLSGDDFFGYGVDAGLGSFMSPEALVAYEEDMARAKKEIPNYKEFYTSVIKHDLESVYPNAYIYKSKSDPSRSVAIFHSGFGDGFYPSFFGYGKDGQPIKLVTTFFVLEEGEED